MKLFLHDDIENYFEMVDGTKLDEATARRVATAYEDGKAILLQGLKPDYDAELFSSIGWSQVKVLKKLKSRQTIEYHRAVVAGKAPAHDAKAPKNSAADQYSNMLTHVFNEDQDKLARFMENMDQVNTFMRQIIKKIFPNYRFTSISYTWRFADTINENLHVDTYREDLPDHHVRMFINLDNVYRIWHTSHRLTWMLENHLDRLPREFLETATPGRICHELNLKVFGGMDIAGREGAPKHIGFFEPGEVWLVDSRKVSHQIFFGRRAVSTEFQVDPASMLDPRTHYYRIVDQYRGQYLRQVA